MVPSHRLIDPFDKYSQEEDRGDGRSQVAGHGLDVIKQLTALGCLDHWYPTDTDGYDAQDPHSEEERTHAIKGVNCRSFKQADKKKKKRTEPHCVQCITKPQ